MPDSPASLILRSFQSPGDVVMLTAAVRDLHAAAPGRFRTDVRTSADPLWENNPHITRLSEGEPGVTLFDMHYPLIHECNRPYHFIHGYTQYLEQQFGIRIPVTRFAGDIYLSDEERQSPPPGTELGIPEHFWIVMAGGKHDFTAKWWNPASYQKVVDHFRGKLTFVQCGEAGHWHLPLEGVINLVGKTTTREFVRLIHHAAGVLCPVTFAMHLAAAVPTRSGRPPLRPCVVVAGGREPAHWEAYPGHQFLSTNGTLPCCLDGGCWRSRCQPVGDGDAKDHQDVCVAPVAVSNDLKIPKCLDLITPERVISAVEAYYDGGVLAYSTATAVPQGRAPAETPPEHASAPSPAPTARLARPVLPPPPVVQKTRNVLLHFRHGLGDAVQFTSVLTHLQYLRPEWNVDVATFVGKHSAFEGLCRKVYVEGGESPPCCDYRDRIVIDWHECQEALPDVPSTKVARCLREVFQLVPQEQYSVYEVRRTSEQDKAAREYLASICPSGPNASGRLPAVLIHYEGNTSAEKKNLGHELVRELCDVILKASHVPVILDWDRRSPLPDGTHIHCPNADHPLWGGKGTGDAAAIAALIDASSLMVGVDSGPLHVAGATTTPTLAVWTHHHPVHYFDLADNVHHLVPGDHESLAAGPAAFEFFKGHYHYTTYRQLKLDLPAAVEARLTGAKFEDVANKRFLSALRSTAYDGSYYEEHRVAGLDYLGHGEWQAGYGRWLIDSLSFNGKRVLDVGCACGSILRGLGLAGAVVQGVDLSEHMIQLGRKQWPDMTPLLHVCDAVNLHLYGDGAFEGLHSAQVAEHWKPELVPFILRELRRVTVPGGLFFCTFDTEELFARHGRTMDHEDPTHICIRPMQWWHEQLAQNGWEVCTSNFEQALKTHSETFLTRYDWDWFVARRSK